MAEILLGVTGGIAAYKSLDVLRILQRQGHGVSVVMTHTAERFVGSASFASLSGREVGTHLFGDSDQPGYHHLDVNDGKDLMLVAPASANTISQMASGAASSLLTSCYLAFRGPVVVAPAMNTSMWLHPATARNMETLRRDGAHIIDPESGLLADGAVGPGRLAEPAAIVAAVEAALGAPAGARDMEGLSVLISAGGTREPIDAVRYVGNRSSGRMGWALAAAARDLKHKPAEDAHELRQLLLIRRLGHGGAGQRGPAARGRHPLRGCPHRRGDARCLPRGVPCM
ncbi:MAG: bifunctional phosphopantothenoylcysteine decarboxylase/phosphopantothenate--cysteine ligase CoaBC [Miltoncostaeaceae bacterium]